MARSFEMNVEVDGELDAVNLVLSAIGESAINSIDDTANADVANIRRLLNNYNRRVQTRGWTFNTEVATSNLTTDLFEAMNHYDVRSEYTAQMGEALALSTDGAHFAECAIMCNLPSNTNENIEGLGSASVVKLDVANPEDSALLGNAIILGLTKMRAQFTNNYVPPTDRYAFTKPEIYSAILYALSPVASNWPALIDLETGNIRNVVGFEVIEVPHLLIGGSGDNHDAANQKHAFPKTGAVNVNNVYALCWHKSAIGHLKLRDMALERGRRINYQGDQIVAKMAVGHGGLRPEACGALVKKA